jgi:branched-chain amino acid transport system permease protein
VTDRPAASRGRLAKGERQALNTTIMLFLVQDGITNGAIYALLGLALVLVFAVTRVILIPQGEFVTYGALTYASLCAGQMPGTARLAFVMGIAAFALDLFASRRALRLPLTSSSPASCWP